MRIETITIDSFGGLSDTTISFCDGINIVEGENESGKSTISAFIKFILYGVSGRAQLGEISERSRYMSWSGGAAKGSMTINHNFKKYRIERSLTVYSDSVRESSKETVNIIDTATNTPCHKGEIPGEVFLGVSEKVFVSTAFFRQLSDTKIDPSEMNSAIENMLFSADESVNTQKALEKLDAARRMLYHKNGKGGAIFELERELEAAKKQNEDAKRINIDIFATEGQLQEKTQLLRERKEYIADLKSKSEAYDKYATVKRFNALHEQERKTAAISDEYALLFEQKGQNGFLPDAAYIKELRETERRLSAAFADLSAKESDLSRLKYESGELSKQLAISGKIDARGGGDAIKKEHEGALISARTYRIFALVLLLLALITGGGGFTAVMLLPIFWVKIMLGAITAVFAAAAVTLFSVSHKSKKRAQAICAEFGAANGVDLSAVFEQCIENKHKLAQYQQLLSEAEARIEEIRAQCGELKRTLDEKLSKCAKVLESYDADKISAVISECEETCERAQDILRRLEFAKAQQVSSAQQLASFDEEQLREDIKDFNLRELESLNINELRRDLKLNESQIDSIESKVRDLASRLAALNATAGDPVRISARIYETERKIEKYTLKHDAYMLAAEAITSSGENLRRRIAPRLADYACKMISAMTDGKYKSIGVSGQLDMSFESDGATHSLDYLSAGTRDLAYIGLRLSLIDLLFRRGYPPLIFDESFAHQDNSRALRIMKLLSILADEGQQSIIFSCHDRESKIAGMSGKFKHIKLS